MNILDILAQKSIEQAAIEKAQRERQYGSISQGTWQDRHPLMGNMLDMLKEMTGVAPSQRLTQRLSDAQSIMLRPRTPMQMVDFGAGVAADTLETGLAVADIGAATKSLTGPAAQILGSQIGAVGRNIKPFRQQVTDAARSLEPAEQVIEGSKFKGFLSGGIGEQYEASLDAINSPRAKYKFTPNEEIGSLSAPRSVTVNFADRLDDDGKAWVAALNRNRNQMAIHSNAKTNMSLDFSTDCAQRCSPKGPCIYCYVESDRTKEIIGMPSSSYGKKLVENPYRGEIMTMPKSIIDANNADGGLRMFSFGDYRPWADEANVAWALEDASQKGLYIKAITKEKALIDRFGDHPNFRANISIDYLPREVSNAPTVEEALQWKAGRPNIKIRSVARNEKELAEQLADKRIDLVTPYHGETNFRMEKGRKVRTNKLYKIVKAQNPQLINALGEDEVLRITDEFERLEPKMRVTKSYNEKFPGKMCCEGGKCSRDSTKCGFGLNALIPGVVLSGALIKNKEGEEFDLTEY